MMDEEEHDRACPRLSDGHLAVLVESGWSVEAQGYDAAIHEKMEALHEVGAINKETMRESDEVCLMSRHPLKLSPRANRLS